MTQFCGDFDALNVIFEKAVSYPQHHPQARFLGCGGV